MKIKGKIIEGAGQAGNVFGIKTANLDLNNFSEPGVFVAKVIHDGQSYNGLCFIGKAYLLKDQPLRIEVHLFDYNNNLKGKEIEIELLKKLRDPVKFTTIEQAQRHIDEDIKAAKTYFK